MLLGFTVSYCGDRSHAICSSVTWVPTMVVFALVLLLATTQVNSFRPYVTCVGCETFLQCFLTCPVADYPGVNQ